MSLSSGNAPRSFSQRVNPLVPESTSALLVEEWTVDPHSTLPSFLELIMIEEVQRSSWQTLKSVLLQVEERLRRWSETFSTIYGTRDLSVLQQCLHFLKVPQFAHFVSEQVLAKYRAELMFWIIFMLERQSLTSSATATISEALHGTKRVKIKLPSEPEGVDAARQGRLMPMQQRDGIRYATLLALGRYLQERGDLLYQGIVDHPPQAAILPARLQKLFRFLYPILYSTSKGLNLIQRWNYLLGSSVYFDLYSRLLGLVLRRLVAEDNPTTPTGQEASLSLTTMKSLGNFNGQLLSILGSRTFRRVAVGLLSSAVGISWFARLQTARQKIRMKRHMIVGDIQRKAPPKPLPEARHVKDCPPTNCPLCRAPRINPTASSSGYVFCLLCLRTALSSKPVCPVTGKACPESSVIRLFEPHT